MTAVITHTNTKSEIIDASLEIIDDQAYKILILKEQQKFLFLVSTALFGALVLSLSF